MPFYIVKLLYYMLKAGPLEAILVIFSRGALFFFV